MYLFANLRFCILLFLTFSRYGQNWTASYENRELKYTIWTEWNIRVNFWIIIIIIIIIILFLNFLFLVYLFIYIIILLIHF